MDVALTEDEQLVAETAERVATAVGLNAVAKLGTAIEHPPVDALVAAGWRGFRIPEAVGGVGGSGTHIALVAEALGAHLVTAPFVGPIIATEALVRAGASADTLEAIAAGELELSIACCADLAALAATPRSVAIDAATAVAAVSFEGSELRVRRVGARVAFADLTRVLRRVEDVDARFESIRLSEADRVAVEAFALVVVAADLLGVMRGALNLAVEHAKQREQFGAPIGSFQAVQQLCAEQLVSIEGARDCVSYAAWGIDELPLDEALLAARVANAYCSRAARTVVEAAIQVLGGIGMTWEHPAHLYLRRALMGSMLFGSADAQLSAIAARRLGSVAAAA